MNDLRKYIDLISNSETLSERRGPRRNKNKNKNKNKPKPNKKPPAPTPPKPPAPTPPKPPKSKREAIKNLIKNNPRIAKALGIDSRDFFMRCLEEYLPVVFNEIVELTKDQPILSQNEIDIIKRIREARPENPSIKTPEQNRAFDNFLATLTGE
jgi:hypothetical protein